MAPTRAANSKSSSRARGRKKRAVSKSRRSRRSKSSNAEERKPTALEDESSSSSESDSDVDSDQEENTSKFVPFPISSNSRLIGRIKRVHATLKSMKQKELGVEDPYLNALSAALIQSELMQSRDKTVRRLVGCCLADIIHIFAPEAPFSDGELKVIFDFLIQQLCGLAEKKSQPHFKYSLYILNKLAMCNSAVILTQLDNEITDEYTSDELVNKLVEALLETLTSWHSEEIEKTFGEVIIGVLEEMEDIRPRLLDLLLRYLLPDKKNDKTCSKSCKVARMVLVQCADRLRQPLSTLMSCAMGGSKLPVTQDEEAHMTELEDHLHEIILELHSLEPSLLLYILPQWSDQLTVDDLDLRVRAVDLVGNIFSNSSAEYIIQNEKVWMSFLQRVHDVDTKIRQSIVEFASFVLQDADSLLAEKLAHYFFGKDFNVSKTGETKEPVTFFHLCLNDRDPNVRKEAVHALSEFLSQAGSLKYVNLGLLKALGSRASDKKVDVATSALEALGVACDIHLITPYWSKGKHDAATEELLAWVPDCIFHSLFEARPAAELTHISWLRIRMLDEVMLGKGKRRSPQARAKILTQIWTELGPTAQKALLKLVVDERKMLQSQVQQLVECRLTTKDPDSDEAATKKAFGLFEKLSRVIPTSALKSPAAESLQKLWECRDKNVFRALGTLCDEATTRNEIKASFDDLASRLGSKSEVTAALRIIVHRMAMNTVSNDTIVFLLEQTLSNGSLQTNSIPLAQLMIPLFKAFPKLLKGNEQKGVEVAGNLLDELVAEAQGDGEKIRKISPNLIQDQEEESEDAAANALHELCNLACNLVQVCLDIMPDLQADMASRLHHLSKCLESLFVNTQIPQLAEPCLLTWIKMNNDSAKLLEMGTNMVAPRCLGYENSMLENTLSGIGVLLSSQPSLFTSDGRPSDERIDTHRAVKFAFNFVKRSYEYLLAKSEYTQVHGKDLSKLCRLKVLSIKIITEEVIRRSTRVESQTSVEISAKKMVLLLRKIVQDFGNPWSKEAERNETSRREWPPDGAPHFQDLRLAAAIAILRIQGACTGTDASRVLHEGSTVTASALRNIQRWLELSWIAMDPSPAVREAFVDALFQNILKQGRLWLQYGALIVMANGVHEGKQRPRSHSILMEVLRKLQRKCDIDMRKGTNYYAAFAPEAMLPYVCYLLAHYPSLPRHRKGSFEFILSAQGKKLITKPLIVLFDALSCITKGRESNAGLLYSLIDAMGRTSDNFDPECRNIHMVGEIARLLIKSRMKVSPDSINHPGNLRLPAILYNVNRAPAAEHQMDMSSAISPIRPDKEVTVKTPSWKDTLAPSLPPGFELGGFLAAGNRRSGKKRSRSKSPAARSTKKAQSSQKKKRKKSTSKATSPPTRHQPKRSSKRKSKDFKGYQEVDSDVDEEACENQQQNGYVSERESDSEAQEPQTVR